MEAASICWSCEHGVGCLGPPVVPFYPCLGGRSPTKIDYRKKGTLISTSLLEDLVVVLARRRQGLGFHHGDFTALGGSASECCRLLYLIPEFWFVKSR